jgi:hypothetical protein
MKTLSLLAGCALAVLATVPVHAQFIDIRLSYKVVINPANGLRPPGVSDADIDAAIAEMNRLQDTYFRGFHFQRVDAVTEIGGLGDTAGPSGWYSTDFLDAFNGGIWKDQMDNAARVDARYHWNNTAINIYITAGFCGGTCSFDWEGDSIIVIGGCADGDGKAQMHEIGHYFSLFHTQGRNCGGCGPNPGQCNIPGDDEVWDTLPDVACWNQDAIASNFFHQTYGGLLPPLQNLVDDVFLNLMSFRASTAPRLTELQLNRWTDRANNERRSVTSGRTWFVNTNNCDFPAGNSVCNPFFAGPFPDVPEAVNASNAGGGDIILLTPGTYTGNMTISKPVTLRASRRGPVSLVGTGCNGCIRAVVFLDGCANFKIELGGGFYFCL